MSVPQSSRPTATRPRASSRASATPPSPRTSTGGGRGDDEGLVFGRSTYLWIGIGFAVMVGGMLLMAGGSMPSPDVWDESLIYSFRRITLAPIVILAGLGVITYAIFEK